MTYSFLLVKFWLSKNFSKKKLGETTYILDIKIYKDRSRRLFWLSQSMHIDYMLKIYKIGFSSILHGIPPSKDMCFKTHNERDTMEMVSYTW
jgi:hypothetical protein